MIHIKRFLFYAMSNYNFNTGELEDVEKLVEQTVQALKSSWNGLGMWIFVQPVKGRWSLYVVLEKSLKNGPCNFLYKPSNVALYSKDSWPLAVWNIGMF